jgi:RHS repeat-associated protein
MAGKPECMHGCRYALKIALVTIFAMGLFNLAVADITRTVGPDGDYSAIEDAMTALLPFQDNVILEVYVGPDGLAPSVDITNSSSFNGYTLTLKGVRAFFSSATYYLNDEIEYEVQHNTTDCKTTEYTKGASLLSRRVTTDSSSSGDQYYIKNHLGSTMLLTSGSGDEIIASFDYFPYGKKMELALTSEYAVTQTFTEKEQDRYDDDMDVGEDGEGWYYFGARYYDADVGLWASCDPQRQFFNQYAYTGNGFNPIGSFDPDGNRVIAGSPEVMKAYPDLLSDLSTQARARVLALEKSDRNYYLFFQEANASQAGHFVAFENGGGAAYFDPKIKTTFGHELAGHGAQVEAYILNGMDGNTYVDDYNNNVNRRFDMEQDAYIISGNEAGWNPGTQLEYTQTNVQFNVQLGNESEIKSKVE